MQDNTVALIKRIQMLLAYNTAQADIVAKLQADGISAVDTFLAYKAATTLNSFDCEDAYPPH